MNYRLTAILQRKDDMYVALCPELDIAGQGEIIEEAKSNLKEVITFFLECASESEMKYRLPDDIDISPIEVEYTDNEIMDILDEYEKQGGENMHCPRCDKPALCESQSDESDPTVIKVSFSCKGCSVSQNITIML